METIFAFLRSNVFWGFCTWRCTRHAGRFKNHATLIWETRCRHRGHILGEERRLFSHVCIILSMCFSFSESSVCGTKALAVVSRGRNGHTHKRQAQALLAARQPPLAEVKSLERKRERETAGGGLANCQGKEDGWGAGGWSWRRKRYRGFCLKIPVPNAIFADFCVFRGGF